MFLWSMLQLFQVIFVLSDTFFAPSNVNYVSDTERKEWRWSTAVILVELAVWWLALWCLEAVSLNLALSLCDL